MKSKTFLLRSALARLLMLGLLAGFILPVASSTAAETVFKYPVIITFSELADITIGQPFTLSGTIIVKNVGPLTNKDVSFEINGNKLGQARTDSTGAFKRNFTGLEYAGTYKITADTTEERFVTNASASTSLVVLPAEVSVQTVPAIEGVAFTIHDQTIKSGPDGMARIMLGTVGTYRLTILADQYNNPDQRIEFALE